MKKNLLIAFFAIISLSIQAQTHLTFKGIPIDGTIRDVNAQLVGKGFVLDESDATGSTLHGRFAGEDATIYVICSEYTHKVYRVIAFYDPKDTWSSLSIQFSGFENMYINKYGTPIKLRDFDSPYYEGDGYELSALKLGKVSYMDRFSTDLGDIGIMITKSCKVAIFYTDKLNGDIHNSMKESSAEDDI